MLDNIESLAKGYLKQKTVVDDGNVGNPFISYTYNYFKGLIHSKRLIWIDNLEIIWDDRGLIDALIAARNMDSASYKECCICIIKKIPHICIKNGLHTRLKDAKLTDLLFKSVERWCVRNTEKYNDYFLYTVMVEIGKDLSHLIKFDNLYAKCVEPGIVECAVDMINKNKYKDIIRARLSITAKIDTHRYIIYNLIYELAYLDPLKPYISSAAYSFSYIHMIYKIIELISNAGDSHCVEYLMDRVFKS